MVWLETKGSCSGKLLFGLCLMQAGYCAANDAGLAWTRISSNFVPINSSTVHPWDSLTLSPVLSPAISARRGCDMGTQREHEAVCAVPLLTQLDPWAYWRQLCAAKINGAYVNTENFPAEPRSPRRESNCSAMLELWLSLSCSPSHTGLARGQSSIWPM